MLCEQAIPQTDVPNAFIDEAWISFVVDLNIKLRTIQSSGLFYGLRSLMKLLEKKNTQVNFKDRQKTDELKLGGLVIELCTFSNFPTLQPSDIRRNAAEASKLGVQASSLLDKNASLTLSELNDFDSKTADDHIFRRSEFNWMDQFSNAISSNSPLAAAADRDKHNPRDIEMSMSSDPSKSITFTPDNFETALPSEFLGFPTSSQDMTPEQRQPVPAIPSSANIFSRYLRESPIFNRAWLFISWLPSIPRTVYSYIKSNEVVTSVSDEDPAGMNLTYEQMCDAVIEVCVNAI